MRRTFAKRTLRQRVIALVAAYAIAFAGVIASFAAAQAAAEASAQPDAVICHSIAADQQAPSGQADGKICADCCIGCMTSLATVIPPTVAAAGPPQLAFKRLDLPVRSVRLAGAKFNAHRSRGPPQAL